MRPSSATLRSYSAPYKTHTTFRPAQAVPAGPQRRLASSRRHEPTPSTVRLTTHRKTTHATREQRKARGVRKMAAHLRRRGAAPVRVSCRGRGRPPSSPTPQSRSGRASGVRHGRLGAAGRSELCHTNSSQAFGHRSRSSTAEALSHASTVQHDVDAVLQMHFEDVTLEAREPHASRARPTRHASGHGAASRPTQPPRRPLARLRACPRTGRRPHDDLELRRHRAARPHFDSVVQPMA
jgi:hypothetical protein